MKIRSVIYALAVSSLASLAQAAGITVTTNSNADARDGALSLTEAILISNGELALETLDEDEQALVEGTPGENDRILFNIPGEGPHIIPIPHADHGFLSDSGFPPIRSDNTVLDGYSQPGAQPNSNGILEPNNAVLQIVISATEALATSEFDMLTILGDNVTVKGICSLGDGFFAQGPNWGINWRGDAAGGQVAGCWIGLAPDGETVWPHEIGVGSCCATGGGHIIGTNGDGVDDVSEFNIISGNNVNTIFEGAANCRISGNFIGLRPDGLTPADDGGWGITEGDATEGANLDGLIFGTNSDGLADEHERNIVGGMADDVISHFGGDNPGVIFAGNYIGVGIDGETPVPNQNLFRHFNDLADFRIGSDLDGVRDEIEANLIANIEGFFYGFQSSFDFTNQGRLSLRGNSLFQNSMESNNGLTGSALARLLQTDDIEVMRPTLSYDSAAGSETIELTGTLPLTQEEEGIGAVMVDLYLADADTLDSPQGETYLTTIEDNGSLDLDDQLGQFRIAVSSNWLPDDLAGPLYFTATANIDEAGVISTSPFSTAVETPIPTRILEWSLF